MVMAVNNAALLGSGATDISGLSDSFRDGQKLRQGYEARQQQKALNELMGIEDFNERIKTARTHKYAGALIPELQNHEEARQKAALENLQASADIGKTFGETGKLGAETGKIGAETGEIGAKTQGQIIQNASDTQNHISALAVAQDPKVFALGIGQLNKLKIIDPAQTEILINMVGSDPQNAAKVLQSMAMANPEIAKIFKPKTEVTDTGDKLLYQNVNGFTGEYGAPYQQVTKGQTPDNYADNRTKIITNTADNDTRQYVSDNTYEASVYGTDVRSGDSRYATDVASNDRQLKLDQDGKIAWAKDLVDNKNADARLITANKSGKRTSTPRPVAATKEMGKLVENIKSNAHTIRNTSSWISKIQNGELNLGAVANMGNAAANRTGIDSLGSNPAAYAQFKSSMIKLASDALRLNTGVQTDMDYKRALEEMQAGTYIPRNNKTAIALLNKIRNDFNQKAAADYAVYADYKREYDGVVMPEYGHTVKKGGSNTSKKASSSKGQALGNKIFGGG